MYARITKQAIYPEKIDEALSRLGEVQGKVEKISGLKYWFQTVDRGSGEGVAIAIYDSKESADAASSTAQQILGDFGEFFLKPPEVNEYEVERHFSKP